MIALLRTKLPVSLRNAPHMLLEFFTALAACYTYKVLLMDRAVFAFRKTNKVFYLVIISTAIYVMYFCASRMRFAIVKPPNNMIPEGIAAFIRSRTIRTINSKPAIAVVIPIIPSFWCPYVTSFFERSVFVSFFHSIVLSYKHIIPLTRKVVIK